MSSLRAVRASLVEASRRYSRVAHEVEDLAHDIILSALRRGSSLESETFLRSARGAARQHAAFLARSAARRRARERVDSPLADEGDDAVGAPLSGLSPTLRTTLLLLWAGLEKAELRLALGVTDAALRKRFQALREHGPFARPDLTPPHRDRALRRTQVGVLPQLAGRALATRDPDGHGLIFGELFTAGPGTATSPASARMHAQGDPCSTPRSRTSPSSS